MRKVAILTLFLLASLASSARAEHGGVAFIACNARAIFVNILGSQYAESLSYQGLNDTDKLVEVFISDTRTWTMLITTADGRSCILLVGNYWEVVSEGEEE